MKLHPDLQPLDCPGGLFDISDPKMEQNIGRTVILFAAENDGLVRNFPHKITGIQKIYDDSTAYRAKVVWPDGTEDAFGTPVRPADIKYWLDEEEMRAEDQVAIDKAMARSNEIRAEFEA